MALIARLAAAYDLTLFHLYLISEVTMTSFTTLPAATAGSAINVPSTSFTTLQAATAGSAINALSTSCTQTNIIVFAATSPSVTDGATMVMTVDTATSRPFLTMDGIAKSAFPTASSTMIGLTFDDGEKGGVAAGCICTVGMIAYLLYLCL